MIESMTLFDVTDLAGDLVLAAGELVQRGGRWYHVHGAALIPMRKETRAFGDLGRYWCPQCGCYYVAREVGGEGHPA